MFKYLAFSAVGLVAGSASADDLTSIQGGSIDLGTYRGVVYYVEEGDHFSVVTTLASADSGPPLRFVVTLSEDEHFVISVPGDVGGKDRRVDISRSGGKLRLEESAAAAEMAGGVNN
jgi:hypothetical protein